MNNFLRKSFVFIVSAALSGCATMQLGDLFSDYAKQQQPVRQALMAGSAELASKNLPNKSSSNTNYQLSLLEHGRLAFLAQDHQQSKKWFSIAYRIFEHERAQAKIRLGKGVENVNALVTNDNAISYQAPAYEQSMMHTYQALNYLYDNNLEGALVEVRRANFIQEQALKAYSNELIEAQSAKQDVNANWQSVNQAYSGLDSRIGNVKNGFQNAYTFYLSGVLYEAANEPNDAYIDYKKALEIYPENPYLQQDVLRLGSALGMDNDLSVFIKRFGEYKPQLSSDDGQLVIIYEQGLIDAKQELSFNFPVYHRHGDLRFYSLALPTYSPRNLIARPLTLAIDDKKISSSVIVKLQSLVAKQLKDQLPAIIARQALRLIAKEQLRRKMSREGGDVGNILAGLYGLASEQADTRSWLTLPADVQLLRTSLRAGKYQLPVHGVHGLTTLPVEINAGRITLAMITNMGSYTQIKVTNL